MIKQHLFLCAAQLFTRQSYVLSEIFEINSEILFGGTLFNQNVSNKFFDATIAFIISLKRIDGALCYFD